MLRWLIAAKAPSTIEATEMTTMICCHCDEQRPNGPIRTRDEQRHARRSWAPTAKKAVTGVGAPS